MAQSSWPLVGENFSDLDWRDSFGAEAGVTGDLDGSSYKVTLAPDSDVAQIGSATQKSTAQVAGFGHRIPAGQPENITVPAATGSARTDIIALRYDPAFTGTPGPVRLALVTGTSTGLPVYDDAPPGIEDLPLYSVTRQPGQALSQATVRQLFPRIGLPLVVPVGAPLPLSSPLGTRVRQGTTEFMREQDGSGVPVWQSATTSDAVVELGLYGAFTNWGPPRANVMAWRTGRTAFLTGTVRLAQNMDGLSALALSDMPPGWRPSGTIAAPTNFDGRIEVLSSGRIQLVNGRVAGYGVQSLFPFSLVFPIA